MVRTIRRLEDPEGVAARQTASLAGLALTLALIVAGLFLVDVLRGQAVVQSAAMTEFQSF